MINRLIEKIEEINDVKFTCRMIMDYDNHIDNVDREDINKLYTITIPKVAMYTKEELHSSEPRLYLNNMEDYIQEVNNTMILMGGYNIRVERVRFLKMAASYMGEYTFTVNNILSE